MKVDFWSSTKKIQLKENSTENSAEKNLKENSKFNVLWNFLIKQKKKKEKKRKEKDSNSKNLVSRTLSQENVPQIILKICKSFSFLSLSFLFLCIKFSFKNFIVCVIFSNQYPNKKAYYSNLLFELSLMAH